MAARVIMEDREVVFQNRLQSFAIVNDGFISLNDFFGEAAEVFTDRIGAIVQNYSMVVVGTCFVGSFLRVLRGKE